jgi:y4mF family transcriptional regulator
MDIGKEIMKMRKAAGLTQVQLAERVDVGLRFVRELEQGKSTVRLDKVNQVLTLFGCELVVRSKS